MSKLKDSEDIEHVHVDLPAKDTEDAYDESISSLPAHLFLPEEYTEEAGYDVLEILPKDEDIASLSEEDAEAGYDVEITPKDEDMESSPEEDTEVDIITEHSDNAKGEDIASSPAPVPAIRKKKRPPDSPARLLKMAERIECEYCHKLYRRDYMIRHVRVHTGEKLPIKISKCKLCPTEFKSVTALNYHMRNHYNIRPYVCTVCGASFRSRSTLVGHITVHTGARPFVCNVCGKGFQIKSTLDQHYFTHTDKKDFDCPECPKRFSTKKYLTRHLVVHAKTKQLECTFCGKRFAQIHVLRKHQEKSCTGAGNNEASSV